MRENEQKCKKADGIKLRAIPSDRRQNLARIGDGLARRQETLR